MTPQPRERQPDGLTQLVIVTGIALAVFDTVAVLLLGAPDTPSLYGLAVTMMLGALARSAWKERE